MKQYIELCKQILNEGVWKDAARPGMPRTKSINGVCIKYNLEDGFPMLTTKKMFTKGIFVELLWLLRGETNINYLLENNVHVWDGDGYKYYCKQCAKNGIEHPMSKEIWLEHCSKFKDWVGEMGHIYGYQWRQLANRDQIVYLLNNIKQNPNSRYHILESWNVNDIADDCMALPPCHKQMQFFVRGEYLDMMFLIRSNDIPLGNPWNISCYAAILQLFALILGYKPGILTYIGGDVHIYENQIPMIEEQITRKPYELPKLTIHLPDVKIPEEWSSKSFDDFINLMCWKDFEISEYQSYSKLDIPLSVGI